MRRKTKTSVSLLNYDCADLEDAAHSVRMYAGSYRCGSAHYCFNAVLEFLRPFLKANDIQLNVKTTQAIWTACMSYERYDIPFITHMAVIMREENIILQKVTEQERLSARSFHGNGLKLWKDTGESNPQRLALEYVGSMRT